MGRPGDRQPDPTPEEIERLCEELRAKRAQPIGSGDGERDKSPRIKVIKLRDCGLTPKHLEQ